MDVEDVYSKFDEWLSKIIKSEKLKKEIKGYNIGIFQTKVSYSLYLMGSRNYDANDYDWACKAHYYPDDKYFDLPRDFAKDKDFQQIESLVITFAKRFAQTEKFQESFLAKAQGFTVGFDDGDLHTIHQS